MIRREVKERPIIFNTEMVRAILDNSKTQTRRVIKPQPHIIHAQDGTTYLQIHNRGVWFNNDPNKVSKYQIGDLLYVRETWAIYDLFMKPETFVYQDDEVWLFTGKANKKMKKHIIYRASVKYPDKLGWRSPYHMFKEFARIWLKVTNVRVERVQDISPKGGIAEGASYYSSHMNEWATLEKVREFDKKAIAYQQPYLVGWFALLWDSINEKKGFGWDTNPWVWVIEFERIEK